MNITPDISNIVVVGNWAAGKTQFIARLRRFVESENGVSLVLQRSDRLAFEDAVLLDTKNGVMQPDGSIVGPHSVLVKNGSRGEVQFRMLDGSLGNEAHRNMLRELKETKPGEVKIVEYATGKSTAFGEGEILDQSGHFLVEHLLQSGAVHNTFVVELTAPYNRRLKWNAGRVDSIDEKTFSVYAQPGGEISLWDTWRMGNHLVRLKNEGSLDNLVGRAFYGQIQQRLLRDTNHRTVEGRPASTSDRGRR